MPRQAGRPEVVLQRRGEKADQGAQNLDGHSSLDTFTLLYCYCLLRNLNFLFISHSFQILVGHFSLTVPGIGQAWGRGVLY